MMAGSQASEIGRLTASAPQLSPVLLERENHGRKEPVPSRLLQTLQQPKQAPGTRSFGSQSHPRLHPQTSRQWKWLSVPSGDCFRECDIVQIAAGLCFSQKSAGVEDPVVGP